MHRLSSVRTLSSICKFEPSIKYMNFPSCKNCLHYKPSTYNIDYTSSYSRCTIYGEKNVVTNKIEYLPAHLCRNDNSKCGIEGKYFEQEPQLFDKLVTHFFISRWPFLLCFTCYGTCLYWCFAK